MEVRRVGVVGGSYVQYFCATNNLLDFRGFRVRVRYIDLDEFLKMWWYEKHIQLPRVAARKNSFNILCFVYLWPLYTVLLYHSVLTSPPQNVYAWQALRKELTIRDALRELGHVVLVLEDGHHNLLHPRAEVI
jgi:hypothetical protein